MLFSNVITTPAMVSYGLRAPLMLAAIASFTAMSGCTTISECRDELAVYAAVCRAQRRYAGHCTLESTGCRDYKSGWKRGYYEVATGGDGVPPIVVPKKYRSLKHMGASCTCARNDWYRGFVSGAEAAQCDDIQQDYFISIAVCSQPSADACIPCASRSPIHTPSMPSELPEPEAPVDLHNSEDDEHEVIPLPADQLEKISVKSTESELPMSFQAVFDSALQASVAHENIEQCQPLSLGLIICGNACSRIPDLELFKKTQWSEYQHGLRNLLVFIRRHTMALEKRRQAGASVSHDSEKCEIRILPSSSDETQKAQDALPANVVFNRPRPASTLNSTGLLGRQAPVNLVSASAEASKGLSKSKLISPDSRQVYGSQLDCWQTHAKKMTYAR